METTRPAPKKFPGGAQGPRGTRGQADVAAPFPQLEQPTALEVAPAPADPGLLLAQLAHEQVQLALHDVHLALRQLLLPSPQLLFLKALLLCGPQQLLFPAAQFLVGGRQAAQRQGSAAGAGPWSQDRWVLWARLWVHIPPVWTSLAKMNATAGPELASKGCLFSFLSFLF